MFARLCHPLVQQQSQVGLLLLLRVCALPRMDYVARTAPPRLISRAAHPFDEHALGCFDSMLGIHVDAAPDHVRTQISLPLSVGGMGLTQRPLQRTSHAAYLAAGMLALTDLIRTASPSTAARWPTHPLCIDMQSCVDALVAHNVDVQKVCAHGLFDEPIATLWTRMSALLTGPLSEDVLDQSYVQSGLQPTLTSAVEADLLVRLQRALPLADRTRLVALSTEHAARALTVLPSEPCFTLRPDEVRSLPRLRLARAPASAGSTCWRWRWSREAAWSSTWPSSSCDRRCMIAVISLAWTSPCDLRPARRAAWRSR
jgi:hypothetical protein